MVGRAKGTLRTRISITNKQPSTMKGMENEKKKSKGFVGVIKEC